ncbi:MAG: TetR/AcrR family transcriptional regulator [Actinomycetota bacterium]|nr:TetR/AcrR family transcriptional regulator [Actinomycetota bacterium]
MLETPNVGRVEARRAATKAEILDAAWDIAREEGLAALSLRDLAARVGMRAPSLYSYFDSKHAIYDAMFAQGYRQALDELHVGEGGDFRVALKQWAHAFFTFCNSDPVRAALMFQRAIPGFTPSPEGYAPSVEFLERNMRAFAAWGITDPQDRDLWTALTSGLVAQQLANEPGGDRWARLIDRVCDMYIDNVLPEEA